MKSPQLLQSFGKGEKIEHRIKNKNAIIYTRVSSKEQTENMSLDVQLKGCQLFASKNQFTIKGVFGGTYESAQSDERKEFQRMVAFAKNSKEHISTIIVYSLERFSRTGENAIWLSRQLRELGITIVSVSQPIDTSNPSGVLQQNILFLFSQYDNDLRRQKCIDGMREKLMRGEWVGTVPTGYSYDHSAIQAGGKNEQRIVINEKGKFVRKIFEMKAFDQLSNTDICKTINKMGMSLTMQRLCDILRNPFYCGNLSHSILNGQVVKGKHPAIISEEVFLLANNVIQSTKRNSSGYVQGKLKDETPLKRFVLCGECGTPLTSYLVKSKNLWYYKCNKIGCKCNRSAKVLNEKFEEVLNYYSFDEKMVAPVSEFITDMYFKRSEQSIDEITNIKTKITELEKDILTVEERYALGKISEEIYDRTVERMREEKAKLEKGLSESFLNLSNPYKTISETAKKLANLRDRWVSEDIHGKLNLQKLCFPEGIFYDRKIEHYRTQVINPGIKVISSISRRLEKKIADKSIAYLDLSASVVPTGIEPVSKV